MHFPLPPRATRDDAELTALPAMMAQSGRNPWLASIFMRRLDTIRRRFTELCDSLCALPRQLRRGLAKRWAMALPAAALLMALGSGTAQAATITVVAGEVVINANSMCSLREAIINANDGAATHADCAAGDAGGDTIVLPAASTFTLTDVHNTTDGENGLPSITSTITIDGNGATIERDGAASDTFRLFHVAATGSLTLDETTVSGGVTDDGGTGDNGGGIFNAGMLAMLNSSEVSGSTAGFRGGGIYINSSALVVTNSTISGNSAGNTGGGIYVLLSGVSLQGATISGNSAPGGGGMHVFAGTVNVINTAINGNSAGNGGGLYPGSSSLNVTDSTISGNSASSNGGGIYARLSRVILQGTTISGNSASNGGAINAPSSTVTLTHATVTGNSAGGGAGGIAHSYTTMNVQNSIVADQTAGADCAGSVSSLGYNIESATSCGFTGTGDQQSVSSGNLALGSLADNGGPTQTHAIGFASFALDTIPSGTNGCGTSITDDQRGATRPTDGDADGTSACDTGAFELGGLKCGIQADTEPNTYTLVGVDVEVTDDGTDLDCLRVTDIPFDHPNATTPLMTGVYWIIRALQSNMNTAATDDYSVDLTLPFSLADASDKVCRYTGTGMIWNCAATSFVSNVSVTRDGITQLSDWAVGNNAGPLAVGLTELRAAAGGVGGWFHALVAVALGLVGWTARQGRRGDEQ